MHDAFAKETRLRDLRRQVLAISTQLASTDPDLMRMAEDLDDIQHTLNELEGLTTTKEDE